MGLQIVSSQNDHNEDEEDTEEKPFNWMDYMTVWDCWMVAITATVLSSAITTGSWLMMIIGLGVWFYHEYEVRGEIRDGKR